MSENLKSIINELYSELNSDNISIIISKGGDNQLKVIVSTISIDSTKTISDKIDIVTEV